MVSNYAPGQIWEVTTNNGRIVKNLIIAVHDGFVNAVPVWEGQEPFGIHLRSGGTVDYRRLLTSGFNMLSNPVCECDSDELDAVLEGIAENIGFTAPRVPEETVIDENSLIKKERDIYKEICHMLCGTRR